MSETLLDANPPEFPDSWQSFASTVSDEMFEARIGDVVLINGHEVTITGFTRREWRFSRKPALVIAGTSVDDAGSFETSTMLHPEQPENWPKHVVTTPPAALPPESQET